jgi:hypothetical protein
VASAGSLLATRRDARRLLRVFLAGRSHGERNSLGNKIDIIGTGCFYWLLTSIQIGVPVTNNSPYIWIRDHEGRYLSNEPLHAQSFAGPGEYASPLLPPIIVPGGSQILVDWYEVNAVNIHTNLVLRGIHRRPVK